VAAASLRVLYRNYRYSLPELKVCNTFLLAHFMAQLLCFFVTFGSFAEHFYVFTGIIGLSVSLNGGMRSSASAVQEEAPAAAAAPAAA
jgi:hypothetical protein